MIQQKYRQSREAFAKCLDQSPNNLAFLQEFDQAEKKYIGDQVYFLVC